MIKKICRGITISLIGCFFCLSSYASETQCAQLCDIDKMKGATLELVQSYIESGADVTGRGTMWRIEDAPVTYFASMLARDPKILPFLIKMGAPIEKFDGDKQILGLAAQNKHGPENLAFLLKATNSNVNTPIGENKNPLLNLAIYGGEKNVRYILQSQEIPLLDINRTNAFGNTALHELVYLKNKKTVPLILNLLIKFGINTEIVNEDGNTALLLSSRRGINGNYEAFQNKFEYFNINAVNTKTGESVLHHLVYAKRQSGLYTKFYDNIRRSNFDGSIRSKEGLTPFQLTRKLGMRVNDGLGNRRIIELLRQLEKKGTGGSNASQLGEYGWSITFYCEMGNSGDLTYVVNCFARGLNSNTETTIELTTGGRKRIFRTYEFYKFGKETLDGGLSFEATKKFSLKAQNNSKYLNLRVKITDEASGKVVYEDVQPQYGVINVGN
jgi:hypothetical protein